MLDEETNPEVSQLVSIRPRLSSKAGWLQTPCSNWPCKQARLEKILFFPGGVSFQSPLLWVVHFRADRLWRNKSTFKVQSYLLVSIFLKFANQCLTSGSLNAKHVKLKWMHTSSGLGEYVSWGMESIQLYIGTWAKQCPVDCGWTGSPLLGAPPDFSPLQVLTRVHCLSHTRYSMNMISLGFINERQLWWLTAPVVQERCFLNISEP